MSTMSYSGYNFSRFLITFLVISSFSMQLLYASESLFRTHHRTKRQSAPRAFVVPVRSTGNLFNVSSWPPNPQEVYSFVLPAPPSLALTPNGMVSLNSGASLNISNFTFSVNVSIGGTSNRTFPVVVYVVNRDIYDPIFINSSSPMWATCPVWIRPGTVIYQVQAIDTSYGAQVQYRIESGGEGHFDVDPVSGEVYVVGRWMFELKKIYYLAISAQIVGMATSFATPSQVLQVYVGALNPQFSKRVYNESFYENQSGVIFQIRAESFQDFKLTYSGVSDEAETNNLIRVDSSGAVTLLKDVDYRKSPHQYNFNITVSEMYTNFMTATMLTLNLLAVNRRPEFLVSYYVKNDLLENVPVGTTVLTVMAYDYDPGIYGELNYTTDDDHFSTKKISNAVCDIVVAKGLDYDLIEGHRYEFNVIATDGGDLNDSAIVQVWMKNINDEVPQFEPPNQSVTVKEGAQAGLPLIYIQAFDPDGDNITFQNENTQDPWFNVDSSTGLVTLKKLIPPGFSTITPSFNLTISITDDGSCCPGPKSRSKTSGIVVVKIYRINRQPVFSDCRSYNASIDENVASNTTILWMVATDKDESDNGRVTFSTFSSENQEYFGVRTDPANATTAQLFNMMVFDRENPPKDALKFNDTIKIPVTVKVQDYGSPPLSTNCILLVTINDVNDNNPVFDYGDYQTIMINNLPPNSRVVRVFATDSDSGENARISYSLSNQSSDNCKSSFTVNPDSGWIIRSSSGNLPSVPTITCYVTASDNGTPKRIASTSFTVNIVTQADQTLPVWRNYPKTNTPIDDYQDLFVFENQTNSVLVSLTADNPSAFGYFLQNDPQLSIFDSTFRYDISNNNSFDIIMSRQVDASQKWKYYLRCRAYISSNPNGKASIARLLVNIKEVNNKIPYFIGMDSNGYYPAAISLYTLPGDWVVNVTAIDLDREWPYNKIAYSFDTDCSVCSKPDDFSIDPDTGMITAASNSFNPNTDSTYTLGVVAEDGLPTMARNKGKARVSIRFLGSNYTSPKFNRNFTAGVSEGAAYNTTVTNATVPESPFLLDIAPQYGIMSGNDGRRFAVDSKTGRVYVVGNIDYLQLKAYTLGYRVFDGTRIDTAFISLTVSRSKFYPPTFYPAVYTSNGSYVEKEDNTIGKVIATVNATTRDSSSVAYSLVNPSDKFEINPQGEVKLKQPLSRDEPDGYATWQINVKANDSSSNSEGYAVVNLVLKDINDHSPTFDTCCLWGSLPEKSPAGYPVLQLQASDPDNGINGTVTYRFPPNAPPSPFSISQSGLISLTGSVNYSAQDNFSLVVEAADGGGMKTIAPIVVYVSDINDNPPIFSPKSYSVSIPEEMEIGASVFEVEATDADVGINAQLTYSISNGGDSAFFYADSIFTAGTGIIKIKQRIDFDVAKKSTYSVTVNVRDPLPNHTDSASLTINVFDINDNAPTFLNSTTAVNIPESIGVDISVAKFSATDKDSGDNSRFSYSIDYRNTDPTFNFKVDPGTGDVTIRNKLDRETTSYYEVHILAIDKGKPPLTGTATLIVNVIDSNDSPPSIQIVDSGNKPYVPAAATKGTKLFLLKATDRDNSTNQPITFAYDSSCSHCNDFTLEKDANNPNQAWLVANKDGGYKRSDLKFSSYNLSISVSDGTNTANYPLTVIVESLDENPPANGEKHVTVYNYARSSGAFDILPLGNVYVKDPDDWDIPFKTFKLVGTSSYFGLRDGGQILMYGNASEGEHKTLVNVVDSKFPNNVAQGTVTVNVKFINDSAVQSSGSLRLSGIESTDLLINDGSGTKLSSLQKKIADILKTQPDYVDIFSISNVAGETQMVDVVYAAHGSPYYTSEKMNALMWLNRANIIQETQLNVTMAPVDLCRAEFQNCWDSGCATIMNIGPDSGLVNTNETSFVGLNVSFEQSCSCPSSSAPPTRTTPTCNAYSCYNSGTCVLNGTKIICICPVGFDGPRCQKTKVSFSGEQSYLYLKPLESCEMDSLSLELMTTSSNGLVLFNGPMTAADSSAFPDFIAVQLLDGRPQLRINLGDGELVLPSPNGNSLPQINDGLWHSLEIFHERLSIQLVVDHCSKATFEETLQNFTMDRSHCEATGSVTAEKFLLNVVTPLQLGGRSDTNFNSNLQKTSISGCIKNLQHNGELYDMSVDLIRVYKGVTDNCDLDKCGSCPVIASCVTGITGKSICQCPSGFGGAQCNTSAIVKNFDVGGYAVWTLSPDFSSTLNSTSALDASLQIMFRTRQKDGILLFGESFSTLERNILEVVSGSLQFRYDLGEGDFNLSLPGVNVSDGVWHTARVERHGNQVILKLDGSDGINFNSTFPVNARRVLRISNLFGIGEVRVNPWSSQTTVNHNLAPVCIQDVRFMDELLPLENSNKIASVTTNKASPDCISTACANIQCGEGRMCYDLWNIFECRCIDSTTVLQNGRCEAPTICTPGLCWNGGTCLVLNGIVGCVCPSGWQGIFCEVQGQTTEAVSTMRNRNLTAAIVVPIIIGLILLVLLILLIVWCVRRRKPDYLLDYSDEYASRENVIAYDEEGAGEEDVQAYDLMRLQKPVDPNFETTGKPYGVSGLKSAAPEPMANRRRLPGDYPSVGDFINDRLQDADDNDTDQDSLRGFDFEGDGSQASSLSSIGSSSSGDLDFGYLNDWGPPFKKLADLYGDQDEEDNEPDVSNV